MPKFPLETSGYTVLPLQLPPVSSYSTPATHFLFLRPHEPRLPDPDSSRSLFLVNIPINTTETHLRHLFSAQLSAGRVERVKFQDARSKNSASETTETAMDRPNSKKRKRITADELEAELESRTLPKTWDRELHTGGAHAVVTFVDKTSMQASFKAAKRAAKERRKIFWGASIEDRLPALGLDRYKAHHRLRYPSRADLLRSVNNYMTLFGQVEEVRTREAAMKTQEPDEDGFVTVTRGPKLNDVAREEEMKELVAKQKEKNQGLEDFYRFQNREKRKERQGELLRKFEEDKKKVEEMKKRRGRVRPE